MSEDIHSRVLVALHSRGIEGQNMCINTTTDNVGDNSKDDCDGEGDEEEGKKGEGEEANASGAKQEEEKDGPGE